MAREIDGGRGVMDVNVVRLDIAILAAAVGERDQGEMRLLTVVSEDQ